MNQNQQQHEVRKAVWRLAGGGVALGLALFSLSVVADDDHGERHRRPSPSLSAPVPKAHCGARDHTEGGLQGQTTPLERSSGDSRKAYNCNVELVGQFQGEGNYSQDGPAYYRNCAYIATDNVNAQQVHQGVVVVDVSDPKHPKPTAYLNDTAAMLTPHETLRAHAGRGILVAAQYNGPGFAVYDISKDCRHPVLKANINLPGSIGHMGNLTPDGLTYYLGQNFEGVGSPVYIVDLTDPANPKQLPSWVYQGNGRPHGEWFSPDGTRMYAGQAGQYGNVGNTAFGTGPDGLVIEDVSDYQLRRSNPQIRIISTLFWDDQGTVEEQRPITQNGRRYVVSSDESGGAGGVGGLAAACARGAAAWGYPNIIDITDEKNPVIVAKIRLEVNMPANCSKMLNDPPDVGEASAPAYNNERCEPDRIDNPRMLACAFQYGGLRIIDVSDLLHPKEIAYYKPGGVGAQVLPGSLLWNANSPAPVRTVDRLAGYAHWVGHGKNREIWTVSSDNGLQILRFSDAFQRANKDLFDDDD